MGGRCARWSLAAAGGQGKGEISLHHEDGRSWALCLDPAWSKVPSRNITNRWKDRWRRIRCPDSSSIRLLKSSRAIWTRWPMPSEKFPYVCTTYSCTEHWCSGALTRWQAWLLEMQPELYVEIGDQLAKEKGIKNGERIKVSSIRGEAALCGHGDQALQTFHGRRKDGSSGRYALQLRLALPQRQRQ